MARDSQAVITDLPVHPMLGVFAVLLGASIATFFGRLISVGTPDLRGPLGLDADSASWLGTAYNMGQMFVGPFSVYLGGILGARRVLLGAACALTVACLFMPFAGHFGILLGLLAMAGLAAGTFYPLTLSIVLRNLSLKYLNYGIAAYVFDIIATTHLAHAYEGWMNKVLLWQWLFWTITALTPIMIVLVIYGIAKSPLPQRKPGEKMPSWAGFLYASAGGALIYGALDQGQRLDWWRSGTFVAMLLTGACLLFAALLRHFMEPNPLIDLPFLNNRNIILLGFTVLFFRFVLLSSVVLVPAYLGTIRGYRSEQTGVVLLWGAVPEFLAGALAVYLLDKVDVRLILATGFTLVACGCLMNSRISPLWSGSSFYLSELVIALGLGLAFNGMAGAIILTGLNSGATKKAAAALTFGGYFQTIRLLGGQAGTSFEQFSLHQRQVYHYNLLAAGLDRGSASVLAREHLLSAVTGAKSVAGSVAIGRSAALFVGNVNRQAFTLSVLDNFVIAAYAATATLILVFFFKPMKIDIRQIMEGAADKEISS